MYVPHHFKNENIEEVLDFIEKNSFGILVSHVDNKSLATHIPLELSKNKAGKNILQGHISKANPQWKNFVNDSDVLAIFNGPHAYISSSWYDHENVPTWNYIAVHIYGKIKIVEGEDLIHALSKLVDKYESSSKNPVSVSKMTPDFLNLHLKGLVGFEIEINDIQAAYKLSQNRDNKNHENITTELNNSSNEISKAVADQMMKHRK